MSQITKQIGNETRADTILAPLRNLYRHGHVKPGAIAVTPETFDAIVDLPELVRELRAEILELSQLLSLCADDLKTDQIAYGESARTKTVLERVGAALAKGGAK